MVQGGVGSRVDRKVLLLTLLWSPAAAGDPYQEYLARAPEFRAVAEVPARSDGWLYMPWRYQWTIGTGDEGGRFCRDHGITGGFTDHGQGPLDWLAKWGLSFYNDHTAGKGTLYLRDANASEKWKGLQRDAAAIRPVPLDEEALAGARGIVRKNLAKVSKSDLRWAYALDDEVSWGVFVRPMCWRVRGDEQHFADWLATLYGTKREPRHVNADDALRQLDRPLREIDFSAFLDRMSYQDSVFAEFVGALVETANEVDPLTPCGVVGAQAPSLWGGYDYAKLMRKVQFLEAYDTGSAPEIARSLSPRAPLFSTHFHSKEPGWDSWFAWSRFAHGQRGLIGWVEGWFDGKTPKPWLSEFAPVLRELSRLGPLTARAQWQHDRIAIYYSHPSVQVSWILDSEAHGRTWPNRNRDAELGTASCVRRAWEFLLNDAGLQYDFVAYDTVGREGVPGEVKVLILPACFAVSDAEARGIRAFAARGGVVVADFMCGLFDQHGRGRARGALDDLFGVEHPGTLRAKDFFGDRLWVESDQDRGYGARSYEELLGTVSSPQRDGFAVPERGVTGNARYLNLSPQRYLALREAGLAKARHRAPFVGPLGVEPFATVESETPAEITRFRKGDRLLLFVVANPAQRIDGARRVLPGSERVVLRFARPATGVRNERTGEDLGDGGEFGLVFDRTAAVLVSLDAR